MKKIINLSFLGFCTITLAAPSSAPQSYDYYASPYHHNRAASYDHHAAITNPNDAIDLSPIIISASPYEFHHNPKIEFWIPENYPYPPVHHHNPSKNYQSIYKSNANAPCQAYGELSSGYYPVINGNINNNNGYYSTYPDGERDIAQSTYDSDTRYSGYLPEYDDKKSSPQPPQPYIEQQRTVVAAAPPEPGYYPAAQVSPIDYGNSAPTGYYSTYSGDNYRHGTSGGGGWSSPKYDFDRYKDYHNSNNNNNNNQNGGAGGGGVASGKGNYGSTENGNAKLYDRTSEEIITIVDDGKYGVKH